MRHGFPFVVKLTIEVYNIQRIMSIEIKDAHFVKQGSNLYLQAAAAHHNSNGPKS